MAGMGPSLKSRIAAACVVGALGGVVAFGNVAAAAEASDPFIDQAQAAEEDVNDPLEPINRVIFQFNEIVQQVILYPATSIYEIFIPPPVRTAVRNVLNNLKTPIILANDILQGEPERAWTTTQRFVINTTVGIGGIFDRAEGMGYERHKEDFGQTMGVWGVGEGLYLVLPIFGPSNPRDAVGKMVVDGYFDPLGYYLKNTDQEEYSYARMVIDGVDQYGSVREELARVKKTSVDYYAAVRSLYRQKRESEIRNGASGDLPAIPDLSYEWNDFYDDQKGAPEAAGPIPARAASGQLSQEMGGLGIDRQGSALQ